MPPRQVFASLLAHIEQVGMNTPNLFFGDPGIRQLNDVIDLLHSDPDARLGGPTHDDPRTAAAALGSSADGAF